MLETVESNIQEKEYSKHNRLAIRDVLINGTEEEKETFRYLNDEDIVTVPVINFDNEEIVKNILEVKLKFIGIYAMTRLTGGNDFKEFADHCMKYCTLIYKFKQGSVNYAVVELFPF